ncbi:MAG: 6,7-dimethyl-8-ribityllumazine synthase [Candidatus Micrarchaeota archaeon]
MKLGFLDSIFNYADVYEDAVKVLEQKIPAVTLDRTTVPHLLKIPLYSKMLMQKGCDAIIVFLTMLEEDAAELDLVHEKIIDLELELTKPVFFCIIADSEFSNQEGLVEVMNERLGIIAEAVAKIVSSPGSLSSDIANQDLTNAMTMFGGSSAAPEDSSAVTDLSIATDTTDYDSGGKSIF